MRAPSFWWREESILATLLSPLAAGYGAIAASRLDRAGHDAGIPVLCIGNPTVGGAGKTPAALAAARWLLADGERPVFLSRGYGGSNPGPVLVDPLRHTSKEVGDEPLLLATVAPTIVARDRVAGSAAARTAGAGVIVMDDGFQNPSLAKQLAVLLIDGRRGIGNRNVIPAGPLRAPLAAQFDHAQAIIVVGGVTGAAALVLDAAEARGLAVFRGRLEPDADALAALRGKRALAFAGIGDPEKFFATLAEAGIEAPLRRGFPDHHRYTPAQASALIAEADRLGLELLTTEKDLARLAGDENLKVLAGRARALPVRLKLDRESDFRRMLLDAIRSRGQARPAR